MKDYSIKFKQLLLPYFLCLIGVISFCSLFNWIFIIQLDCLPITDIVIEFFIPGGISIIAVVLFIRKGIHFLKFKQNNGDNLLYFIAILGIFIPTLIAQEYIESATGKLTSLESISQLNQFPKTKYYTLKRSYFCKKTAGVLQRVDVSGKHNEHLDFYVYTLTAIMNTPKDTLKDHCDYWLCKRYLKSISNRLDDSEKERQYAEFLETTHEEYMATPVVFSYLKLSQHSNDLKYYKAALKNSFYKSNPSTTLFFEAATGKFENRNGEKLKWFFLTSLIGLGCFALLLLAYKVKTPSELKKDKIKADRQRARGWRKRYELILPHENFVVTPILIYINTLFYIAMVFAGAGFISFDYPYLYNWGGVIRQAVMNDGEWWRLFSCIFLHNGIMHLLNNMLSLFFVGLFLERLLGKWRYLIVYLICGIVASLTSIYWHESTLAVGASGAIFGMYGFVLALTLLKQFNPGENKFMLTFAGIFVVYNLIYGLAGGVDNAAHIGGLCSGFFIGLLLSNFIENPE